MKLARLGITLVASALVAVAGASGCEAIVNGDVPPLSSSCASTPYALTAGACQPGEYCFGAGCTACNPKGDDPCDGYDNDCDGVIDNGPKSDHDGDGYTYCGKVDANGKPIDIDCNDDDKTISPKGNEVCNGKDDNCDGIVDNPDLVCAANQTCVPSTGKCISNTQACNPSNCPPPKVCDTQTQQCVLPSSQDAGSTGCTSNEQCTTGICAGTSELGPGQPPVCTQPCCTSADCAAGYVCFGAGTGGDYCVAAASLTRAVPGSGAPGANCARGEDCRSGVCAATKCEDTCCGDASCTNGTTCAASVFGASTTFACVPPPGNTATNHSCNGDGDCTSGFCQSYQNGLGETVSLCVPACCSSLQCGSYDGVTQFLCYDETIPPATSGAYVPVCDYPQPSNGPSKGATGSNVGDDCASGGNRTCFSNRCLTFSTGKKCSDVCCIDSDCGKPGWVCRPTPDGPGTFLRCVPSGG